MITNQIAYWRSTMNQGKGISRAHLARQIRVGRSYVTKLEKGTAQPGAEIIFRVARYFRQPIEAIFQHIDNGKGVIILKMTIPVSQFTESIPTLPTRPAGMETVKDKSLVGPTAKVVASPVAQ